MIAANRKVLVLNKGWNPVAVVSLERAMCLIMGTVYDKKGHVVLGPDSKPLPKAHVIDATQDFRQFSWADWSTLIASDKEAVIRSATNSFRIPEIIVLSVYNKLPQQRVHFSRRIIYRRDGNQCQYCGCKPGTTDLSLDHLTPRSRGGQTVWENIVLSCTKCNRKKANRTMQEAGMKFFHPGYKPVKPQFTIYKGDYKCQSWIDLMGEAYWETELENDNIVK